MTYVLDMPEVGPSSITFEQRRVDLISPRAGGRVNSVSVGWPLWYGRYTLGRGLGPRRSDAWRAFVDRLDGSAGYFLGRDYRRPYPLAYLETGFEGVFRGAGSTPFDGAATTWSRATNVDGEPLVNLEGLPGAMPLNQGDYLGFKWTTGGYDRRALVRIVEGTEAANWGAATVVVRPAVHLIVPPGAIAHFDNPACLMKSIPGETSLGDIDRRGSIAGTVAGIQDLLE